MSQETKEFKFPPLERLIELDKPTFGPAEVCHLAGLTRKDLMNWLDRGSFEPKYEAFTAKGGKRLFSAGDIIVLSAMKCIAGTGLPLEQAYIVGQLVEERMQQYIHGEVTDKSISNHVYILAVKWLAEAEPGVEKNTQREEVYHIQRLQLVDIPLELMVGCGNILNADFKGSSTVYRIAYLTGKISPSNRENELEVDRLRQSLKVRDMIEYLEEPAGAKAEIKKGFEAILSLTEHVDNDAESKDSD